MANGPSDITTSALTFICTPSVCDSHLSAGYTFQLGRPVPYSAGWCAHSGVAGPASQLHGGSAAARFAVTIPYAPHGRGGGEPGYRQRRVSDGTADRRCGIPQAAVVR